MSARARKQPLPWLKPAVLAGALIPLADLVWRIATHTLGADWIAISLNKLGLLALIFLVATLACTPAKRLFGWTWPMRIRRLLGQLTFLYAALHVSLYLFVDQGLNLSAIWADIHKRPFITSGFLAFCILVPLAATSTDGAVRKLRYPKWKALHRGVYLVAPLVALHFIWRVKRDIREPLCYATVLGLLLLFRAVDWGWKRGKARLAPAR